MFLLKGHYLQLRTNATIPRGTLAIVSNYLGATTNRGCTLRFWVYLKGDHNGELVVGYRRAIGDEITPIAFSSYQSCQTVVALCPWQRIEASLNDVLTDSTEVKEKKHIFQLRILSYVNNSHASLSCVTKSK